MSAADNTGSKPDLINRGDKGSNPVGIATFVISRAVDPFIQYAILKHGFGTGLLHKVGVNTLPPGPPAATGIAPIDALGLSPYRLALLGMSVGSMLKQNYWAMFVAQERMSTGAALAVGVFNFVFNTFSSLAFLADVTSASTSSEFPQTPFLVGSAMYVTGLLGEWVSEVQRKNFKMDPKNKGKLYTGGLWSLARHINYGSYTLWRAGYALVGGGWTMAAVVGAFFFYDFSQRAVPILDKYCTERYGEDWAGFKQQTPYKLFPYIY
ncbi:hypothetical protein BDY21DRAFT_365434 [Lineolata rhizophorae]|uniref:Steroid 5-alpha reductase C-terminal domain-containing protein n=1 Tax=Lineolata rhizophorae TaxID=578093 RepID=A0A6A6NVH0_9PEZI|nr:hypothetical protein BDY21DRAFT_365434 [Lineolata rhizophorae]